MERISLYLPPIESANGFRLADTRCNGIYTRKLEQFQLEVSRITDANESEIESILGNIKSLYSDLRMSGYFVSKRAGILREWLYSMAFSNQSTSMKDNKMEMVLSVFRGECKMNQLAQELHLGDLDIIFSDILIQNSWEIALKLDVSQNRECQRFVAGILHSFWWDKVVHQFNVKLPPEHAQLTLIGCDQEQIATLKEFVEQWGLVLFQPAQPIIYFLQFIRKDLSHSTGLSQWDELQRAKEQKMMWFRSSLPPIKGIGHFKVTTAGPMSRFVDMKILQSIIWILEHPHPESTEWLDEKASDLISDAIEYASNENSFGVEMPQSQSPSNQYPRLFMALKKYDVRLLSTVLERAMQRQYREWVDGNERARFGAKAWRMHGLATSAIVNGPLTESNISDEDRETHLIWGDMLAEGAWYWNTNGSIGHEMQPHLRALPWFQDHCRLREIQTALPWLIQDDFIMDVCGP